MSVDLQPNVDDDGVHETAPTMAEDANPAAPSTAAAKTDSVTVVNPHPFSVVVASKSPIKLASVKRFYKDTHPNADVFGVETETSFPQPLGIEQAEQCVDERLACAELFACDNTELLIALENYVYVDLADETHRDACLLAVRRAGRDTQLDRKSVV